MNLEDIKTTLVIYRKIYLITVYYNLIKVLPIYVAVVSCYIGEKLKDFKMQGNIITIQTI